jgi:hypothetical protein
VGSLRILDGDREEILTWKPDDGGEVETARTRFERLRGRGFMACRTAQGQSEGGPLVRFDPLAEEILLIRFVDGG